MNGSVDKKNRTDFSEALLSIEVTTQCNLKCSHCFAINGKPLRSNLSIDVVKDIIYEGYVTGYRHLHFTGGEPLLWKGLFVALNYAVSVGYKKILMNTNGTLLSEYISSRLAAYDCLAISVSLEGTKNLHKRLRGIESYRLVELGIKNALDAGIEVIIFTTVCQSLLPDLTRFAEGLYKKFPQISYLTLIRLIDATDGVFGLSEELLDPEHFLQLVRIVSLLNLYGLKTYVLNDPLVNVVSNLIEMPWIPQSMPLYRTGNIILRGNGSLGLSHSTSNCLGKYEFGIFEKFLLSNEYRDAFAPDNENCPTCKYTNLCREFLMVRPPESYKRLMTDAPYCKKVLDMATP